MDNVEHTNLSSFLPRLWFGPAPFKPGLFFKGVILLPRGARLAGVAVRELGTEKAAEPPLALIIFRILIKRSVIARGVGWSISFAVWCIVLQLKSEVVKGIKAQGEDILDERLHRLLGRNKINVMQKAMIIIGSIQERSARPWGRRKVRRDTWIEKNIERLDPELKEWVIFSELGYKAVIRHQSQGWICGYVDQRGNTSQKGELRGWSTYATHWRWHWYLASQKMSQGFWGGAREGSVKPLLNYHIGYWFVQTYNLIGSRVPFDRHDEANRNQG